MSQPQRLVAALAGAVVCACACAGVVLLWVPPVFAVAAVAALGCCTYAHHNKKLSSLLHGRRLVTSLKTRFALIRSWIQSLEYLPVRSYQSQKVSPLKLDQSRLPAYSAGNASNTSISPRSSYLRNRYNHSRSSSNTMSRSVFPRYSLSSTYNTFDSSTRLESTTHHVEDSPSLSSRTDGKGKISAVSPWRNNGNSPGENGRIMNTIQTVAGPLLSSSKLSRNASFDLGLFIDAGSPGLATRVVQYAEDSGVLNNKIVTHLPQYSSPGQFPRVQLSRSASKLPVLSPRNSQKLSRSSSIGRLPSPEQLSSRFSPCHRGLSMNSPSLNTDPATKSLLETLREISRKRMHSQLDDETDVVKRQRKSDIRHTLSGEDEKSANAENEFQSKRPREDSPKHVTDPVQQPNKRFRNNEILSSLSSSRKLIQAGGMKRKTNTLDWSRSSTPVFGKHMKTADPGSAVTSVSTCTVSTMTVVSILAACPKKSKTASKEKKEVTRPSVTISKKCASPPSQPVRAKLPLESSLAFNHHRASAEEECQVTDVQLLQDKQHEEKSRLASLFLTLNKGESLKPLAAPAVKPTAATTPTALVPATCTPAACLSTATYTTSVLPTIPSSSAQTTANLSQLPRLPAVKRVTFSDETPAGNASSKVGHSPTVSTGSIAPMSTSQFTFGNTQMTLQSTVSSPAPLSFSFGITTPISMPTSTPSTPTTSSATNLATSTTQQNLQVTACVSQVHSAMNTGAFDSVVSSTPPKEVPCSSTSVLSPVFGFQQASPVVTTSHMSLNMNVNRAVSPCIPSAPGSIGGGDASAPSSLQREPDLASNAPVATAITSPTNLPISSQNGTSMNQSKTGGFTFGNPPNNPTNEGVKQGGFSFGAVSAPAASTRGGEEQVKPLNLANPLLSSNNLVPTFGGGILSSKSEGFGLSKENTVTSSGAAAFPLVQPSDPKTQNATGGFKFGFPNSEKPALPIAVTTSSQPPSFQFGTPSPQTANLASTSTQGGFGNPFATPKPQQEVDVNQQKSPAIFSFGSTAVTGFPSQANSSNTSPFTFGSSAPADKKPPSSFQFGAGTSSQPNRFMFNSGGPSPTPFQAPAAGATFTFGAASASNQAGAFNSPQPPTGSMFGAGLSNNTSMLGSSSQAFNAGALAGQSMFNIGSGSTAARARPLARSRRQK